MSELKIGMVVRLRSGGPRMTVVSTDVEGKVTECYWFIDDALQYDRFPTETVEEVKDDEEG